MGLDIIGWVKGWRLDKFFKKLFKGENTEELTNAAAHAVLLLEKIREASANPTIDEITARIPGDWDQALVAKGSRDITSGSR
jgi:hypothetical protein